MSVIIALFLLIINNNSYFESDVLKKFTMLNNFFNE